MQAAFVTYENIPTLTEDDKTLARALSQRGIVVSPAIWSDPAIDWQLFDVIILRSMWDYFIQPEAFNQWLEKIEQLGCNVLNPLSVVKWNQDKHYFDDFLKNGVLLPPYVIASHKDRASLKGILENKGWHKAVVKPTVSGGAYHTWVVDIETADAEEMRFSELTEKGDVIVQQFVEEIGTRGELSLVFFNKKFSHAVCKKAKSGDFRVQEQFGGISEPIQPDEAVLTHALAILNNIPESLLYARVDGVMTDEGEFLLMELELIEPSLFIYTHPKAGENFCAAFEEMTAVKAYA